MVDTVVTSSVEELRNDYAVDIVVGDFVYPSVEHAYQAAKALKNDTTVRTAIANASVREARRLGLGLNLDVNVWENKKLPVMSFLLRQKFMASANKDLREALLNTGDSEIVMDFADDFWGIGRSGGGENVMGKILMSIRSEIQFINGELDYFGILPDEDDSEDNDDDVDEDEDDSRYD